MADVRTVQIDDGSWRLLDDVLLDDLGCLKRLPASFYDQIPYDTLRAWCHYRGRYGLPTVELAAWIHKRIGTRPAIEIGAGNGDLANMIGITATDSKVQAKPAYKAAYEARGQVVIDYPGWVKRKEALDAIEKYEPQVVVASWVTQLYIEGDPNSVESCAAGVDEERLLDMGVEYIFIGNEMIHEKKRILARPHETHRLPFIRSRSIYKDRDVVWIWKGNR